MPYTPSMTMARQRVFLRGDPEFDEHLRRLDASPSEAKRRVIMGLDDQGNLPSSADQQAIDSAVLGLRQRIVQNPGLAVAELRPRLAAMTNTAADTAAFSKQVPAESLARRKLLLGQAERDLAAEEQAKAAALTDLQARTDAADAAEAANQRVNDIITYGPGDAATVAARQRATLDPAEAGRQARLAAITGAANLNPIKAEEASTAMIDFHDATHPDFSAERMTQIAREKAAAAAMSAAGGGPQVITDLQGDTSMHYVGPGAGHNVVVPGGLPTLGPDGQVLIPGTKPTTKFVPSGPDEVQQLRHQSRLNALTGAKVEEAMSQAKIDVAKYAGPAMQADIAGKQAQVQMVNQAVELGRVHLDVIKQAVAKGADTQTIAALMGGADPMAKAGMLIQARAAIVAKGASPTQLAMLDALILNAITGQDVVMDVQDTNWLWNILSVGQGGWQKVGSGGVIELPPKPIPHNPGFSTMPQR